MAIKPCKCGSYNIYHGLFVKCRDCGLRTKSYQLTIGDYQSEEKAAISDWNCEIYETVEQRQKREATERVFRV